ncbi:MAG: S8 family serine peptidase [Acidobacteriota bacterium]
MAVRRARLSRKIFFTMLRFSLSAILLSAFLAAPCLAGSAASATLPAAPPLVEALLVLRGTHDAPSTDLRRLAGSEQLPKTTRGRRVAELLTTQARESQQALRAELERRAIEHRPFWIVNAVWVRTDAATLLALGARPDVERVAANPRVRPDLGRATLDAAGAGSCPSAIGEGVAQLGAPALWDLGIDGEGVVIGGQDTGYDWDHPALRDAYRGWDLGSGTVDHDYAWHDAIHSGGGVCGADSPEPCDDNGHGTHTMGIAVADDGVHRLGVAPGARWIGCRNMDRGNGTPATYLECLEWFLAPTRVDGSEPDPARAPDVLINSWICPPSEGCNDPDILREAVEALRAAGIFVVASAGNSGPSCGTITAPPAIYGDAFTVGAVNGDDDLTNFSSRGPVSVDGSGRIKPDLAAPGSSICSAARGGGFTRISGTSMAGPHVAGLVALAVNALPCLRGRPGVIADWLRDSAIERLDASACGGFGAVTPNAAFGFGSARATVPAAERCDVLFGDGFESGETAAWKGDGADG